jgi:hypothetical protein
MMFNATRSGTVRDDNVPAAPAAPSRSGSIRAENHDNSGSSSTTHPAKERLVVRDGRLVVLSC